MKTIEASTKVELKFLFSKKSLDEEFYIYYISYCQRMLESRLLLKDQRTRHQIFTILEFVLNRQPSALKNLQIKLINLIYEDEEIVEPIADFLIKAYNSGKEQMATLTNQTLTLLITYIMEKTNISNESQAVKNIKDFLCKVSESLPRLFYNNLTTFLPLYDSEVKSNKALSFLLISSFIALCPANRHTFLETQ
jgi:condensin complex subunit 1